MTANIEVKHTLIDESSIRNLLVQYNLENVIHCSFLSRGLNDTYLVTTKKESYIFRIYRYGWRDRTSVHFEIDAINHLRDNNFNVSFPILNRNNSYLCEIAAPEGLRYGVLFSYTKGERPLINEESSQLIGGTLGKMHELSDGFQSNHNRGFKLDLNHLLDEPVEVIAPVLKRYLGKEADEALKEVVKDIKTELAAKELEVGFCHGDFHNHNMHINNREIEVFDFDCSAIGYRAYDVAVSWWNLINNYKSQEQDCWGDFLTGYLNHRNLSKDDRESLPLFITARRIWLLGTMLRNDDVWGTNWINKASMELFILQVRTDMIRDKG
ncbi:phosphotransferase [Virgibacillus sp. C22-A2]|uniref:Phosphotransferase n=1 Tax=Virgibacillus tibetensis TaxID=3042313 RepID=A0ABU6KF56_9BACI|nr:phosphotransferase [Virgibacillus sp. C22-A2]